MTEQHVCSVPPPGIAELSKIMLNGEGLTAALRRIADIAQQSLPQADEVSVTVVEGDRARTVAFTGDLAVQLDERQYSKGFGPCLDAAVNGVTVLVDASDEDPPYPEFAHACARAGISHVVAVVLPIAPAGAVGGLNVYVRAAEGLNERAVAAVESFATYAAVAVANATTHDQALRIAAQLQEAMNSRAVIEQAKGILMASRRVSADRAFQALVQASQRENVKLRTIAQRLVDEAARTVRPR